MQTLDIIKQTLPTDYEILGRESIEEIIETIEGGETVNILKYKDGSNFDIEMIIKTVVALVTALPKIIQLVKEFLPSKPNQKDEDLIKKVRGVLTREEQKTISDERLQVIIECILKK